MITTLDSSLFPAFLRDTMLPAGTVDNRILWAQPDVSLHDRFQQVEELKKADTDITAFPYCSYARSDAIELMFDASNPGLHAGVSYVGKTGQLKNLKADRAEFVYTCIYRSRRQDELIDFEKKFLRTMKYAHQLTTEITGTDIDLGYEFIREDFDTGTMYRTEDYFEEGKLFTALFDIRCRCWLIEQTDVAYNINTIKFNLFGYGQEEIGDIQENIVIT